MLNDPQLHLIPILICVGLDRHLQKSKSLFSLSFCRYHYNWSSWSSFGDTEKSLLQITLKFVFWVACVAQYIFHGGKTKLLQIFPSRCFCITKVNIFMGWQLILLFCCCNDMKFVYTLYVTSLYVCLVGI